jgi:hypothetical protein
MQNIGRNSYNKIPFDQRVPIQLKKKSVIQRDEKELKQIDTFEDIGNRRKFFEDYAKNKELNPLKPETWYSQSRKSILDSKV